MARVLPVMHRWPRWRRRMQVVVRRANLFPLLEIGAVVSLIAMLITDWVALSRAPSRAQLLPSGETSILLIGTLIPAMAVVVLLGRWLALRRADASSGGTGRLHVRLVFLFSLIAAVPTLMVVIFASFLFQTGVEFWFSDSSRGILENANKLARGYYEQKVKGQLFEESLEYRALPDN